MAFPLHSILFCLVEILLLFGAASAQLSTNYYAKTCPKALSTIRIAVLNAVTKEHRMGASLLRLHFHDCFVNACSISFLSLSRTHSHRPIYTCTHIRTLLPMHEQVHAPSTLSMKYISMSRIMSIMSQFTRL